MIVVMIDTNIKNKFNFRNKNTGDIYRIYDAGKIKFVYKK